MAITLTKQETDEVVSSTQRFFLKEFDQQLTSLQARQVLRFGLMEIAPFAYNRGVKDAEVALRRSLEDLTATCAEEELAWSAEVRRQRAR